MMKMEIFVLDLRWKTISQLLFLSCHRNRVGLFCSCLLTSLENLIQKLNFKYDILKLVVSAIWEYVDRVPSRFSWIDMAWLCYK